MKLMEEQVAALDTDIARLKLAEEQANIMHKQQVAVLHTTMTEQEERRMTEIARLKEELSRQYNAVSLAERENFNARNVMDHEKLILKQKKVTELSSLCCAWILLLRFALNSI